MGISSWLAFSSRRILFFKRSFTAWSFFGSSFFFFRWGSALMGMRSQKDNNEPRWWVSLICVCQVPRSQLCGRRARANTPSPAADMASLAANPRLPGAFLFAVRPAVCSAKVRQSCRSALPRSGHGGLGCAWPRPRRAPPCTSRRRTGTPRAPRTSRRVGAFLPLGPPPPPSPALRGSGHSPAGRRPSWLAFVPTRAKIPQCGQSS